MFFDVSFDDLLDARVAEVEAMTPEQAESVEFGATTIIGILSETAAEVREEFDGDTYDSIVERLFDAANDRIEKVRIATVEAQVAEVEVEDECETDEPQAEDDEAAKVKAVDDVVESLFAAFIGAEAAADMRKRVEAGRAEAEVEVEEEDPEAVLEAEVEEFLASLFRV